MFIFNSSKRMIDKAHNIVTGAVDIFQKTIDEVHKANDMLIKSKVKAEEVISDLETKISEHKETHSVASKKYEDNTKLIEKLKQFVV